MSNIILKLTKIKKTPCIIQLYDTFTIRCFQLKIYDLLDLRRFLDVQQYTVIRFK